MGLDKCVETPVGQKMSCEARNQMPLIVPVELDCCKQQSVIEELSQILPELSEHLAGSSPDISLDGKLYSKCIEELLRLGTTRLDEATNAANILRANNSRLFFATLESLCSGPGDGTEERLCRGLELLEKLGHYDSLLPWLRMLSEQPNERVRSKAVKLLCKAVPQKMLIERQLKSSDNRVRANAIEALWFHQTDESTKIFRAALSDSSHRVVVNALVGLCHQNDESAMQKLIALSQHQSEMFRAAVIWALTHLYDDRAIEPLKALSHDHSELIRKKAAYALAKLLYVREWIPFRGLG